MPSTNKINANASGNEETERARQIEDAIRKADAEREAKAARADTEETPDKILLKILTACDALSKRMDALEAQEQAKADAEAAAREPSDPEKLAADSTYKGAPMEIKDNVLCDAYGDPVPCARNVRVDASSRVVDHSVRTNTDNAWLAEVHHVQARADQITSLWGAKTPAPLEGESVRAYKVRCLTQFKHHSPAYKSVENEELASMSPATFAVAENQIYNDANQSGRTPVAPEGQLVPYYTTDDAGRRIETGQAKARAGCASLLGPGNA